MVAREMRKIARSIIMEEDFPSNHLSGKLPILSMEMWWEGNMLLYQHYVKPMASRAVIMAMSAFPTSTKRNVLVEEGMRRLRNCSPSLPWYVKKQFLDTLAISMMEGGHKEQFRVTVMMRVIGKYEANLKNHLEGNKIMYRTRSEREDHLVKVGRSTKSNWFRKTEHTSTVTFPTTPGDGLVGVVKSCLQNCIPPRKTNTKVLGGGGMSVKGVLVKSNPFPRNVCGRADCPLKWMEGGCKERCYREMVGYSSHCTRCRNQQISEGKQMNEVTDSVYYGESSRSLMTRAENHFKDYQTHTDMSRRKPASSWMWDHTESQHGGVISNNIREDYTFKLQGVFQDCLSRQLDEAVRISMVESRGKVIGDRSEGTGGTALILNRKEEYYSPKIVHCNFFT